MIVLWVWSSSVTIFIPIVRGYEPHGSISITVNLANIVDSGVLSMTSEKEERELVPVRVKPTKSSDEEVFLDDVPDPEETGQQAIPRRWYIF
jgi:hypothetical protein